MFTFRQFVVHDDRCAMKVGTDGVLLGAWHNCAQTHSFTKRKTAKARSFQQKIAFLHRVCSMWDAVVDSLRSCSLSVFRIVALWHLKSSLKQPLKLRRM